MDEENRTRVFVYGTLKPGARYHEMFCGTFTFRCHPARVKGKLFDFPQLNYPGAQEDDDHWIQGFLLSFSHSAQRILPRLDKLEGYHPNRPHHLNEYYRKVVEVFELKSVEPICDAWCYFMEASLIRKKNGVYIPIGVWH